MKYHPAWERKGALAHAAVRMDLEDVMLMKHASLYKDKCWVISVPGGSQGKRIHRNRKESGDYQARRSRGFCVSQVQSCFRQKENLLEKMGWRRLLRRALT